MTADATTATSATASHVRTSDRIRSSVLERVGNPDKSVALLEPSQPIGRSAEHWLPGGPEEPRTRAFRASKLSDGAGGAHRRLSCQDTPNRSLSQANLVLKP